MTTVTINTVAATVADDVKAFRSAAVTAENKATPFARSMLAALMSGVWTRTLAESAIIHAFGNPKAPKSGKPVAKLSGLRDFVGGDAVRKTAETVFEMFANLDAVPTVRPIVTAFVLGDEGAAKSLRALNVAVRDAVKAHVEANAPDNSEAVADNDAEAGAVPTTSTTTEPTLSLADHVMQLAIRYEAATPEEKSAAHEAFEMLWDTVNRDVIASADEAFEGEQADLKIAA